ncbi:uncharacterized protein LOC142237812 [Haematobia irritans]|uniref:uncharacterized protein LOC142237812 n=1 Tax=Haematobia irritans TaxID=7368 RepID=UPI003F503204
MTSLYNPAILCRLCLTPSNGYKQVYDENGNCNMEISYIVEKYFSSKILEPTQVISFVAICFNCWNHISDFYSYQNAVLCAQENFQKSIATERFCKNSMEPQAPSLYSDGVCKGMLLNDDNAMTNWALDSSYVDHNSGDISQMENVDNFPTDYGVDTGVFITPNSLQCSRDDDEDDDDDDSLPLQQLKMKLLNSDTTDMSADEYDDPVGIFTGGEFSENDNPKEIATMNPTTTCDIGNISSHGEEDKGNTCYDITVDIPTAYGSEDTFNDGQQEKTNNQNIAPPAQNDPIDFPFNDHLMPSNISMGNSNNPIACPDSNSNINESSNRTISPLAKNRRSPRQLDEEISKFQPYLECVICCRQFASFTLLRKHFSSQHRNLPFFVYCCGRRHDTRSKFHTHLMRVHRTKKQTESSHEWDTFLSELHETIETKNSTERIGINKCPYCPETFVHYSLLNRHLTTAHGLQGLKSIM